MAEQKPENETHGTVVLALFANLAVVVAKLAGGLFSGSPALLSEAAHSVADTMNEVFLLTSLGRSAKPPDRTHPFGYGAERFFWSLLAAGGIFVSGAGFSLYQGITALTSHEKQPSNIEFYAVYGVLVLSVFFEGASLRKAVTQVRGEAGRANRNVFDYIRLSPDPTVKTVASEDSVAVVGILVAGIGTALHQVTGIVAYEGVASLIIAGLLGYVAFVLGRDTKELLIGEAADPAIRVTVFNIISARDEVVAISQILTMHVGPAQILVASRLQFADDLTSQDIERVSTEIERELSERVPEIYEVFLDSTRVTPEDLERIGDNLAQSLDEVRHLDGDDAAQRMRSRAGRLLKSAA